MAQLFANAARAILTANITAVATDLAIDPSKAALVSAVELAKRVVRLEKLIDKLIGD